MYVDSSAVQSNQQARSLSKSERTVFIAVATDISLSFSTITADSLAIIPRRSQQDRGKVLLA